MIKNIVKCFDLDIEYEVALPHRLMQGVLFLWMKS